MHSQETEKLNALLPRIDRLVAALERKNTDLESTLWSIGDLADWFGLSQATIESRVVTRKSFPAAVRPVATTHAQRRWFASDVVAWARNNRGALPVPRPGRRRQVVT